MVCKIMRIIAFSPTLSRIGKAKVLISTKGQLNMLQSYPLKNLFQLYFKLPLY
jgi:hypothetical protein